MNVSVEQLLAEIGKLHVENAILKQQLAAATEAVQKGLKPDGAGVDESAVPFGGT